VPTCLDRTRSDWEPAIAQPRKKTKQEKKTDKMSKSLFNSVAAASLMLDSALSTQIVRRVACTRSFVHQTNAYKDTEIDWSTYMQQVKAFLNGTTDYSKIAGDTGPLVYPGGHVLLFTVLQDVTGGRVKNAQFVYLALYIASLFTWLACLSSTSFPFYAIPLLILSKRLHSIYLLRLFNDPWAMFALYLSILSLQKSKWSLAAVWFSIGVSIKMNILLFAPAFMFLNVKATGWNTSIKNGILAALIQVLVALPFKSHPIEYLAGSFELTRKFLWKWTVNWRFVGQETFESDPFSTLLLISHMVTLSLFYKKWNKIRVTPNDEAWREWVLYVMVVTQFIGIVFARSLHYQFYSWYFWTVPYMLFSIGFNPALTNLTNLSQLQTAVKRVLPRLIYMGLLEWCWLQYPSTATSSGFLFGLHMGLLAALYRTVGRPVRASRIPTTRKQE